MTDLHIVSAKELLEQKHTKEQYIADQLRNAASVLENGYYEGAAWRLADACLDFVVYMRKNGIGIQGFDIETGRGVRLDKIIDKKD